MVAGAFISLAGFYFVKNTIQRDRETRVEQSGGDARDEISVCARQGLSNLAVLMLMIVVLAASGLAMQLALGEDRHVQLWTLLSPFLLFAFPAMAYSGHRGVFRDDSVFAWWIRQCRVFLFVDRGT